jgi:hypothetical protein
MDKAARKAAKRARKEQRREAARAELPRDIPIIWCEPTGIERCHRGHWCDQCKVYTETEVPMTDWDEDFPDPRPATACRQCGQPAPMNSRGIDTEMRRPDTGEIFTKMRDLPLGACWEQRPWRGRRGDDERQLHNWISNRDADGQPFPDPPEGEGRRCRLIDRRGKDGRVLVVRLPDGHDWVIDSRANNCTLPLDDKHWCWVREGRPEDGTLHVGKSGRTCSAGAGSIATGRYHGFLRHGRLVSC